MGDERSDGSWMIIFYRIINMFIVYVLLSLQDSAYYFDAGTFWLDNSGCFVKSQDATTKRWTWSAYRLHEEDPLFIRNGGRLQWRNGELVSKLVLIYIYIFYNKMSSLLK